MPSSTPSARGTVIPNASNITKVVLNICDWHGDSGNLPTGATGYHIFSGSSSKSAAATIVTNSCGSSNLVAITNWPSTPPVGRTFHEHCRGYIYADPNVYDGPGALVRNGAAAGFTAPVLLRWDITDGLKYVKQ